MTSTDVAPTNTTYHHDSIFVGTWRPSASTDRVEVTDASTGDVMGSVPAGARVDVDLAVAAAKAAYPRWSSLSATQRADRLRALADKLAERTDELATLIAREVGSPIELSRVIQVEFAIARLRDTATLCEQYRYRSDSDYEFAGRSGTTALIREPFGVVASITPWNFPLLQIINKIAPALGVGNTVVIKPSEIAPLTAYILAEAAEAAGFDDGVINLISGLGDRVGAPLAEHPDVDFISFTGSTAVGRRIAASAAATVKRVALELGGKGPNVVLPGADLSAAVDAAVADAFYNNGQTCSALTRLLVHEDQQAEVEQLLADRISSLVVGPALDESTEIGPLISERQQARALELVRSGIEQGARVVPASSAPAIPDAGYFVAPTVLSDVTPLMRVHQEEIFGPVLVIETFRDEDGAVELANDTPYGLSAGVWSSDRETAIRVGGRLRAGQVFVNGAPPNPMAPFGGYKQSGLGREVGLFGLEEFLEIKALQY